MTATTTDRRQASPAVAGAARGFDGWWVVLAAAAAGIAVLTIANQHTRSVVSVALEGACGLGALCALARRFREGREHRALAQGSILIQLALLALLGANAFVSPDRIVATSFTPRAEVVSVAVYPLLVLGLMALLQAKARGHNVDSLLESLIVPAVLVFVAWSAISEGPGAHPAGVFGLGLGRAGLDLVVVLLAARLLDVGSGRLSAAPARLLAAGTLLQLFADVARTVHPLGGPSVPAVVIAGLMLGGWALLAASGLHPSAAVDAEPVGLPPTRLTPARLGMIMAAILVGPGQLVIDLERGAVHSAPQIAVGIVVLSGLAVAFLVRLVEEGSRIEHFALHDDLTGLPNRLNFAHRVENAVAQAERDTELTAVMFLDLDRFKTINDSLGHAAGNDLLRLVAQRLRHAVREEDTVARLGGDEFTVLLPRLSRREELTPPIDRLMDAFSDPFRISGRDLFVSPSVGIAICPGDGRDVDTLVKNADAAMYRAKAAGRQTFRFYTPDMNAEAHKRLALESSLHTALERGEIELHYQPKVDLRTGGLIGMEALARWHHRDHGLLLPDEFIPLAEETGLIAPLGEWILETACTQTRRWRDAGQRLSVAVNLSARQFQQGSMADVVAGVLRRTGLEASALELELTESLALEDPQGITSTLRDIKGMGVSCSIDDFGTGYSGLSYLGRLPIDALKIDKSFVGQITDGDDEARIVAAVIALAHQLHMKVIAEGVETEAQMAFLRDHGCDTMQGYLVSRPLPAEAFDSLLLQPDAVGVHRGHPSRGVRLVDGSPTMSLRVWRSHLRAVGHELEFLPGDAG